MDPDDLNQPITQLDSTSLRLRDGGVGGLQAYDATGFRVDGVTPLRLFPLSDPDRWIVLLDKEGREVASIEEPNQLDGDSATLLNQELKAREFVPHISKILWISGNSEPSQWRVATDRGVTEFVLNDEKDIRRLGVHGVLIIDAHGIRYLIHDDRKLDRYSRRIVEWYIT